MAKAVDRLMQAFSSGEKICIYADFDLDGTSGLALLWTGLKQLGFPEVQRYQPKRLSEGYGFHAEAVEDLAKQGVKLIVTVDVGITAPLACEKAQELGIDVVLTDHHLPGEKWPPALAVVNPNQPEDTSGLNYLCGAGVAFYLLRALKKRFQEQGLSEKLDLKAILDFFTIATLTDMVPLVDDNRVLVKHGLVVLQETKRPGLRVLLEELGLSGRPLTSQDVAIRFAPKLNALSRMEAGILPIDLLLCESTAVAKSLVGQVMENNSNRVHLQSSAEEKAMELLKDWPHEDFSFVVSEEFHRGVIGLIATKLAQNFNRPAFVGAWDPQEGVIVGSARLPNGSENCLVQAMTSASQVLSRFGGHSAAAGFELHEGRRGEFVSRLADYFLKLKMEPKPMEIVYDLDLNLGEVNDSLMTWHDFAGPFGVGFQVPIFRLPGVQVLSQRELRGGHLKLRLTDESGGALDALLFSPTPRQREIIAAPGTSYDLLGELQWNYFAGKKTIQILVKDLKTTGTKWQ